MIRKHPKQNKRINSYNAPENTNNWTTMIMKVEMETVPEMILNDILRTKKGLEKIKKSFTTTKNSLATTKKSLATAKKGLATAKRGLATAKKRFGDS